MIVDAPNKAAVAPTATPALNQTSSRPKSCQSAIGERVARRAANQPTTSQSSALATAAIG